MKTQSLIVGVIATCCVLPVLQSDADAIEKQPQGTQLIAQQSESDRAAQLVEEGDRLVTGSGDESLLRAVEVYQEALDIFESLDSQTDKAYVLLRLGLVYSSIGEQNKALEFFEQALPVFREVRDRSGEATTLNNIGYVYELEGEQEKALAYYEQALPIHREVRNKSGEASTLNNIGYVYDSIGEKEKALEYYEQALPVFREIRDGSGEAVTLNNIGDIYDSIGEKDKALAYYEQALPIHREVRDKSGEASTLNNIGGVYDSIGEQDKALEFYEQALPLLREVRNRSGEVNTLGNITKLSQRRDELAQALKNITLSIEIIEDIRSSIGSDDLRTSYFETVQVYYRIKSDILMQMEQPKAAFETAEAARARVLVELLNEASVNIREGVPSELLEEEDRLRQDLLIIAQKCAVLRSREHDYKEVEELDDQSNELLQQLDRTLSKIRQVSPAYADTVQPQPL